MRFEIPQLAKLILVAASALLPVQALGQAPTKVARVGVFHIGDEASTAKYTDAFIAGMAARGYAVGKNLVLDVRYSDGSEASLDATAKALVANSDVVFAPSGTAAFVARKHGPKVPIVICCALAPVGYLAKTLAQPGGTVTGLTNQGLDIVGKRLELFREILPKVARVGIITTNFQGDADELTRAGKALGIEVHRVRVKGPEDIDAAFADIMRWHPQALTLAAGTLFLSNRQRIVELAAKHQVPMIYWHPDFVDAGGLMSYAAERLDLHRRAAIHVDKILRGAKPGDLPIEQPTKFELVINAKTAKALGLTIPQSLLLRADRVLE